MRDFDPIDFEGILGNPEDEDFDFRKFLSGMKDIMETINSAANQSIYSELMAPFGKYTIITGPDLDEGGHFTGIQITPTKGKETKPVMVEHYDIWAEAQNGHYSWQKIVANTFPTILKDYRDGSLHTITLDN